MLKQIIIPSSIGIAAIMVVAVMFVMPTNVDEKTPGLVPPGVNLFEMIGNLNEMTTSTPNIKTGEDARPIDEQNQKSEVNTEYLKYSNTKNIIDGKPVNVKVLSNKDNSRITILLSPEEITNDKTNIDYIWNDKGIIISMYERTIHQTDDVFTKNPSTGYKVVQINEKYDGIIKSVSQQMIGDVKTDAPLTLRMVSDDYQITIKGFISDDQAIKLADYLSMR